MPTRKNKRVDSRCVIMLDEHLEQNPDHWPVARINDTLEEARAHRQFIRIAWRLPRSRYDTTFIEPKSLVHTPTNTRLEGGIYSIHRR